MQSLLTPRLRLVPLSPENLASLVGGHSATAIAGATVDPQLVDLPVERAIRTKLDRMPHVRAADRPWLTYWLAILRSEGRAIGLLGFKGPPDERGSVEIGYGVAPEYRNRGLTTEAATHLIGWAFSDPRCTTVVALGVRPGNDASERVLAKLGMWLVRRDGTGSDWRLDSHPASGRPA